MMQMPRVMAAAAVLIVLYAAPGQCAPKKKPLLSVKLVFTTGYDDNILEYSARDITRFRQYQESYTSPISTTDDWINSAGLRLYREFKLSRRFRFRPYYSGKVALYAVNPVKNTQTHNLQARFSYRSLAYLTLKYLYIPKYFLRTYYDNDTHQYHRSDFTLTRYAVNIIMATSPNGIFSLISSLGREPIAEFPTWRYRRAIVSRRRTTLDSIRTLHRRRAIPIRTPNMGTVPIRKTSTRSVSITGFPI